MSPIRPSPRTTPAHRRGGLGQRRSRGRGRRPDGEQILRFAVTHDAAGLRTMIKRLLAADVAEVGIERPDGPVVDALRQAGLTVYVIPPGSSRTCAAATARPATRTTGSTPTCWPTSCAPTGAGCAHC